MISRSGSRPSELSVRNTSDRFRRTGCRRHPGAHKARPRIPSRSFPIRKTQAGFIRPVPAPEGKQPQDFHCEAAPPEIRHCGTVPVSPDESSMRGRLRPTKKDRGENPRSSIIAGVSFPPPPAFRTERGLYSACCSVCPAEGISACGIVAAASDSMTRS